MFLILPYYICTHWHRTIIVVCRSHYRHCSIIYVTWFRGCGALIIAAVVLMREIIIFSVITFKSPSLRLNRSVARDAAIGFKHSIYWRFRPDRTSTRTHWLGSRSQPVNLGYERNAKRTASSNSNSILAYISMHTRMYVVDVVDHANTAKHDLPKRFLRRKAFGIVNNTDQHLGTLCATAFHRITQF